VYVAFLLALELVHMDELIDELLLEERMFDTILPRIQVSRVSQ